MNPLLERLFQPASLRQRAHIALCALWIGLATAFAGLALVADVSSSTKLPRAGFHVPPRLGSRVGKPRFEEIVNDLAEKHDRAAAGLEEAVHHSARTSLILNLSALLASLLGFRAQWLSARLPGAEEISSSGQTQGSHPVIASAPANPLPQPAGLGLHDGSFPDEGYAR